MPPAQKPMTLTSSLPVTSRTASIAVEDALGVGVDVPVRLVRARVAPAEQEGLQAAARRSTRRSCGPGAGPGSSSGRSAAARRASDAARTVSVVGRVLQELGDRRPCRSPHPGSAPGPLRPSGHRASPSTASRRCGAGRAASCPAPATRLAPPVSKRLLQGSRVADQGVGRRQRAGQDAHREAGPLGPCPGPSGSMSSTTLSTAVAGREVGLGQPLVDRVARPRRVLEPPVPASRRRPRSVPSAMRASSAATPIPARVTAEPCSIAEATPSSMPAAEGMPVGSPAATASAADSARS